MRTCNMDAIVGLTDMPMKAPPAAFPCSFLILSWNTAATTAATAAAASRATRDSIRARNCAWDRQCSEEEAAVVMTDEEEEEEEDDGGEEFLLSDVSWLQKKIFAVCYWDIFSCHNS